jgi:hypothetical protein
MSAPHINSNFPTSASSNFRVSEDRDDSSHTLSASPQPNSAEVLADTDLVLTETANQLPTPNGSARDSPKASLFDAAALLDPKGKQRSRKDVKPSSSQTGSSDVEMERRAGPGLGSLIENLHGVEDRVDAPRKRRKVSPESEKSDDEKKRAAGPINSSGLMSGFLKEHKQEMMNNSVHTPTSDVVDLTLGELNSIKTLSRIDGALCSNELTRPDSMSIGFWQF